ncbi:GGDEF domain-containing protein [Phreatobacter sp.]|uniref:GGDEF domain-containing protein n=1 Tax=Phreatobacter sp. TaxID=1966341 RepID=UPI0022C7D2CF|nr:GGDEF domain-containing protein [Phreatobacter sp.]MCZ8315370.1 GGDEF domain-containing protein [Phreatobacter sp.]
MTEYLHPRTIALAVVVVSMTAGLLLLMSSRRNSEEPSLFTWGIANVVGSVGVFMLALRNIAPDTLSIVIANFCTITAYMLNVAGVLQFCRRRVPWGLIAMLPLIWLVLCQIPSFYGSIEARLTYISGTVIIASFAAAAVLWRLRDEPLPTRIPTVIWYCLHGCVFIVRFVVPLLNTAPAPSELQASPVVVIIMVEALVHVTMISFLLLLLIKDRAEGRYRRAAETDVLTGQPNRRAFLAEAERLVADATRWPACMLVIDVDRFKNINDTVGHAGGDAVLVTVATTIRSHLRPTDTFGRLGGEEFGALLPNTTLSTAMTVAEGLRARVAALDIAAGGTTLRTTVSIGVSVVASGKPDLDHLIDRADACLYEAKRTGRNRVVAREDGIRLAG